MPFYDPKPSVDNLINMAPADVPDDIDPTMAETFGAAFRTQNVVGSWMASRGHADPYRIEDDFDAIDYVKDDPVFSPYVEEFAGIFNKQAADAKKLQIQRELEDQRTLAASGPMGIVASIGAGVVDLPTLLPIGGPLIGSARGLQLAGRVALASGLDAAVSEAALQATQVTRTLEESAINIGGSVVLGGALGGLAARYLSMADMAGLSLKIERQAKEFEDIDRGFAQAASGGAAAKDTGPLELKDEAFLKRIPVANRQDPLIRLQLSDLDTARQTVRGLAETPLEYADNAAGIATEKGGSVETRMKMWHAPMYRATRAIDTEYARYYHGAPEPSAWQRRLSPALSEWDRFRGGQKLTYKQFKEEVGRAAYMGGQHEIPEVRAAAAHYRELDEALKKAAIDARLFPEDVEVVGDISHRFRMYNKERIIADRNRFADVLHDYFRTQRDIAAKVDATATVADEAAKKVTAKADEFSRLSDDELRSVVDDVIDTILGNAEGRIPYDIVAGPRGPLKDRVLKIETAKIHDFVENDIEQVMHAQMRTMSADVELSKKYGSVDLKEELRKINDEANARIAKAKTQKERQKLDKARKKAVQDVEGIRDRLRGTYALPSDPSSLVVRVGRIARNLNYVRLLGGMTISAIPDMAKITFTHGLTSTFRDGFIPLVKNFKAVKLAGEEVKAAGTALDMVLDSRTMAMADITDDFGRHSKFERGLSALSSKFGVVSLMAPWNAAMKQFSGLVTMNNILRASDLLANGKAGAGDIRKLAASGIDADLATRISQQFAKHGEKRDGVWLAQGANWTDREALEAFRAAVVRDVDRIIVTPGQDKPLWMSTELGKALGQFRSFAVSSMQKTFMSGIQQRDAATLNGTLIMMGLGALVYAIKEKNAGRELSDDPRVWAVEAFDRSGLTGWFMEANNIAEKASRGRVGASALTGKQVSRYASRNVTGAFLGPSADAVADIFQVSGSIFAGDMTQSDLRKMRQMLPFQNLFYVRKMLNQVEEATGGALSLPDTRRN
jgi:ElaB/YqjD/DUF883 family membrane-anchored ribosome-binding protein